MALLDQINKMKQQGLSENQIAISLQEQGFSPKEVSEALSQSQIKSAVGPMTQASETMSPSAFQAQAQVQPSQVPQQGYATQEQYPQDQGQYYQDQNQEQAYAPEQAYQDQGQYAYPEQAYAPEQGYAGQEQYYQQALDPETVREISKQVMEVELDKIKDQIADLVKLKTELKFQIQNIDNRLIKIEDNLQGLQSAILKKIGDYGESIQSISKDLEATQESFSKLVNPLLDQKRSSKPKPKTKSSSKEEESSSAGFEDYFR